MPISSKPMNILHNADSKLSQRSKNWRQDHTAEDFVSKMPSITMLSLYEQYRRASYRKRTRIIHKMLNVWLAESKNGPVYTETEVDEEKKLMDFVFRYYRHKFNDDINSDNSILLHEAFELMHLVYKNPDEISNKRWIALITSSTQSGKTFLMIALCHIFTALGYDCIFIVKDVSQTTQFLSRKNPAAIELQRVLKTAGFSNKSIKLFDPPLYHDSSMGKKHHEEFCNEVGAVLNRSRRRSIVCIHNAEHIRRVYYKITHQSKIILFVDEAHKLGAYKQMTLDTEKTIKDDAEEGSYDQMYVHLKVFARKIFLFTATPQPILISEPSLYSDSIVLMPEGKDYRGIETWEFRILPSKKEEKYIELEGPGLSGAMVKLRVPESFFEKMAILTDEVPIDRVNKFGIRDRLPIGLIAKFEVTNEGQHMLLQSMKPNANPMNEHHQKIIDSGWCVIVFNMHGIRLYDNSLRGTTIKICGRVFVDGYGSGEFLFPREIVQIEDVLHWMGGNGGAARFPHYIIFTYKSAEEGITFSSKWGETHETNYNIHPTFMFSRMGESVTAANKEQASGRMNGNHGDFDLDGRPLVCIHWDTLVGKEKLIKGVNMHRQQIKDICAMKFEANDGQVIKYMKGYKMFSNRVCKNYYGNIAGAQSTIKKVVNPHAAVENESFIRHKRVISTLQMINPGEYDGEKRQKRNIMRMEDELVAHETKEDGAPTAEAIRVYGLDDYKDIISKFCKWRTATSNVAKFIKAIHYTKVYTNAQFKALCKYTGVDPTHTQRRKYAGSSGYGKIIEKFGKNKFRLYPVLQFGLHRAQNI
jgi:hypothetical protein